MTDDEFWIGPLEADEFVVTLRACFNDFAVTIRVERRDQGPISKVDAEHAFKEVMARVPQRAPIRKQPTS